MILFITDQSKLRDKLASLTIKDIVADSKLLKVVNAQRKISSQHCICRAVKIFFQIHTIFVSQGKLDSACLFEFVFLQISYLFLRVLFSLLNKIVFVWIVYIVN